MKKTQTSHIMYIMLSLLCLSTLGLVGCGDKYDSQHLSSRRAYLQKLVVEPELISEQAELTERWIVAHNGCGKADVGGLYQQNPAPEQVVARAEPMESENPEDNKTAEADETGEEVAVVSEEAASAANEEVSSSPMFHLKEKVRPLGDLEGYALVSYKIKHNPEGDSTIKLCYQMSSYPVFYLRQSEIAGEKTEEKQEVKEAAEAETGEPAAEPVEEAVGDVDDEEAEAEPEKPAEVFLPITPVIIEASDPDKINIEIRAHGLLVELSSDKNNQEIALRCAEEIARRIRDEIAINQRAINEIRRQKGEVNGLSTYSPFWGYMGDHIDLDKKEYQPLRKEF